MHTNKVGLWNPGWEQVEFRTHDYFSNYDIHIRFWIPPYDQLIAQTIAIVEGEIARIMRGSTNHLTLLEIWLWHRSCDYPALALDS